MAAESSAMTPERIAEIARRAELCRSITEGPNALLRALASADDVPDLLAEVERLANALAIKTEVAKSNKRVVESYAAEVERVTRILAEEERAQTQLIDERDDRGRVADALAEAIARLTGVEIGEHSTHNDPWENALAAAKSACPPPEGIRS